MNGTLDISSLPGYVDSSAGGMWRINPYVLEQELLNNPGVEDRRYFMVSDVIELLAKNGIKVSYEKQPKNPS